MKQYVLFVGGGGARAAEALLVACCAGVLRADQLQVLLADTDHRGTLSAGMLRAKFADYSRMQEALQGEEPAPDLTPFRTSVSFSSWPESLPGGASTLQEMTADSDEDALLCQAFFAAEDAALNLRNGFHGQRMLGKTVFAALLDRAAGDPADALTMMIRDMNAELDRGGEVRVVLCGSVTGGTGAAGLPLLAHHVRHWTAGRARIGAVLLAATDDHEDPAKARAAIAEFAGERSCSAVCLLGLPVSSCSSAPADYAHLTDWLAVYSMDVLLHRPVWPEGLFTVQTDDGPLTWGIFGKAADRYRLAYGRLMKAAVAWNHVVGPRMEGQAPILAVPLYKLSGWYLHFFRKAAQHREDRLSDAARAGRLMWVVSLWMANLLRTLPQEMTRWEAYIAAKDEAYTHYQTLTELAGQLVLLDEVAQQAEAYEDSRVYRELEEEQESQQTIRRIDAVRQRIDDLREEQAILNGRIGGAAAVRMLQEAQSRAHAELAALQARYAEAVRRIEHAEQIAAPEDRYRIDDARTKLERMVRNQRAREAEATFVDEDVAVATGSQQRYSKPALPGRPGGNGLFDPALTEKLFRQDRATRRRDAVKGYPLLLQPADGRTFRETLKRLRKATVHPGAPVISLLRAIILEAMEEE